jgi:hypothetical protein
MHFGVVRALSRIAIDIALTNSHLFSHTNFLNIRTIKFEIRGWDTTKRDDQYQNETIVVQQYNNQHTAGQDRMVFAQKNN